MTNPDTTLQGFYRLCVGRFLLLFSFGLLMAATAVADGTRAWVQSKFEDLVKGTASGVAIRSAGGLELAPSF
jgi:hypothetical protein